MTENERIDAFQRRRKEITDFFADREPVGYIHRIEFTEVACRLYRGDPLATILPTLHELLKDPHGDMFWMVPMVLIHYLGRERLPETTRSQMRDLWRTYTPYRGDTENHWLMYYASLYLMSRLYPKDAADSWFNGRSAGENQEEAASYIDHWIDVTTSHGQGEFDSPHYLAFYVAPLALLYAFADDDRMKKRAHMMLDYIIADFAVDTLNGLFAGAFSRIYPEPTLERWRNGSTTLSWLLFGNVPFRPDGINVILPRVGYRPHGVSAIMAMSGYVPDAILHGIATDRTAPYVHRELKRPRRPIRHADLHASAVYKYVYMSRDYAVGSIQGDLVQPIQQHSWEVLWDTDDPFEGFNVLFTLHPYSSPHEMAMFFPEESKLLTARVISAEKPTYDSPDKWTGGSPYERIFQHRDTVVVLYDIPKGTRFPHVSGFFSRTLRDLEARDSGWLFARAGRAFIAYFPLAPYEWRDEPDGSRRLHSEGLHNGAVVHVAPTSGYRHFDDFKRAVEDLTTETTLMPVPAVACATPSGDLLSFTYGKTPRLNGIPIDYETWPLFEGPFMISKRNTRRLELRHGRESRVLDFQSLLTG